MAGTLSASLVTAGSPATLLGMVQPAAPGGEERGVVYAPGRRHELDIYLPAASAMPPPGGGGWKSGDRAMYRFVGRSLAACGAIAFVPDYRVWPESGFRGFMEDAAQAVAFARGEAVARGGDMSRFFLMGHSAGAHIATILALDPAWLARDGIDTWTELSGVVGLAGPYDFLPLQDPVLEQIFAPVGPRTQPITFAANAKAPLLLMTGANDTTVYPRNSLRLAERVRETGGDATTIVYPGISHVTLLGAFTSPLRFLAPVRQDACRFLGLEGAVR